jgi:hypothetical protein
MTDELMRKKYGMTFDKFESSNVVKERKFSWDVESDSMEWEHAVEGVRYVEHKLKDVEGLYTSSMHDAEGNIVAEWT